MDLAGTSAGHYIIIAYENHFTTFTVPSTIPDHISRFTNSYDWKVTNPALYSYDKTSVNPKPTQIVDVPSNHQFAAIGITTINEIRRFESKIHVPHGDYVIMLPAWRRVELVRVDTTGISLVRPPTPSQNPIRVFEIK